MINKSSLAMVGLAVALIVGCGRSEPPVEPVASKVDAVMEEIGGMVEQAQSSGDWSEALARLEQAMGEVLLDERKGEIFRHLLTGYVQSGDTNKAVAVHLEHRAEEALCQAGCAVIGRALGSREDPAALLAWSFFRLWTVLLQT